LAAKVLEKQNVEVTAFCFGSYFFNEAFAKKAVYQLKILLKVIDFSEEH